MVDAETGELHEQLSNGQRAHDLDTATGNLFAETLDLQAGGFMGDEIDPHELIEGLQSRYDALWTELYAVEDFTTDEMWRIEQRIARLNGLGFDIDELDIVTDWTVRPSASSQGRRGRTPPTAAQSLTGLDVEENQARRLLNDLDAFTAHYELQGEDPAMVAHRWLTQIYEPIMQMVPEDKKRHRRSRDLPRDPRAPLVPVGVGRPRGRHLRHRAGLHPQRARRRARRGPGPPGQDTDTCSAVGKNQ